MGLVAGFEVRVLDTALEALGTEPALDLDVKSDSSVADVFVEMQDWTVVKDDLLVFLANFVGIAEMGTSVAYSVTKAKSRRVS